MQFGPLTRNLLLARKFLSQAPRARDGSLSPSPTADA